MEKEEKNLESIRRHTFAQTILQVGALAELEANRQQLTAQTKMMEEASREAFIAKEGIRDLARLLDGIAEVEIAAKANDPRRELVAILEHRSSLADVPVTAGLAERVRAKELLLRIDPLFEKLRAEDAEWLSELDKWWADGGFAERIREIDDLSQGLEPEILESRKLHAQALATKAKTAMLDSRIKNARLQKHWSSVSWKIAQIETEYGALARDQQVILLEQKPQLAALLTELSQARRGSIEASLTKQLQGFESEIAARKASDSTMLGCGLFVGLIALVIFGYCFWVWLDTP